MLIKATAVCGLLCSLTITAAAPAQTGPLVEKTVPLAIDSGWAENDGTARGVVFSTVAADAGAPWLRLQFDMAELGDVPAGGEPTVLRLTSLHDGAVQHHTATTLVQWMNTSAYFNGEAVLIEIVADPGAGRSRIVMTALTAGDQDGGIATICGPLDDRLPSDSMRDARLVPVGCTAWIIDDMQHCFLSAGHCTPSGGDVIEFNVPESGPGGDLQHPGPEDQYVVDPASAQTQFTGLGNDWSYFGCFENTETGLTAFEAQGDAHTLAAAAPPVVGQTIRITGYGTDSSPSEWNQIQQTHAGPYVTSGLVIEYEVDTTGGNSGSAVLDTASGEAIGIHTNGGCNSGGGANLGTSVDNVNLQAALDNPQGVCLPPLPVAFVLPDGHPDLVDPAGGTTIRVEVLATEFGAPEPGTGLLHLDSGGGFVEIAMIEIEPNVYDAAVPAIPCGDTVQYYFSAESTGGEVVTEPRQAPADSFDVLSAVSFDFSFADDFETDMGWTVTSTAGLTAGAWERGLPAGFGDRGDPAIDADGSGRLYGTELADGNTDVDDGSTTLTSPLMDATEGDAHITYYRWYSNTFGNAPLADTFLIEVSPDGGLSWATLELIGPDGPEVDGGWFFRSFRVADVIPATGQFQIRFTASDLGEGSVVEAAVDGVRMNRSADGFLCDAPGCRGDVAQPPDGQVNVLDLVEIITTWGQGGVPADINEDGVVDVLDLVVVITGWGACPR